MIDSITSQTTGAQHILTSLNTKLTVGSELTSAEKLMSSSAYASQLGSTYGPSPRESQPNPVPLPEVVQGAIASAKA